MQQNKEQERDNSASYLELLPPIIDSIIAPATIEIDSAGAYPRAALTALGEAGLLGLVSAREVGGMGEGFRATAYVVERIARSCASTAMVVCMHHAGLLRGRIAQPFLGAGQHGSRRRVGRAP